MNDDCDQTYNDDLEAYTALHEYEKMIATLRSQLAAVTAERDELQTENDQLRNTLNKQGGTVRQLRDDLRELGERYQLQLNLTESNRKQKYALLEAAKDALDAVTSEAMKAAADILKDAIEK